MAINYSTLFARLGRLIKWQNDLVTYQGTTLLGTNGMADDILDEFEARRDLVKSLQGNVEGFAGTVAGWIGTLKANADLVLADLQLELNAPSAATATILALLVNDMIIEGETVEPNVISAPVVSALAGNTGNGTIVASVQTVEGIDDERVIDELVEFTCNGDQYSGTSAGGERFGVVGYPTTSPNDWRPLGNGTSAITVADGSNKLLNGDFEDFATANTPDNWTLGTGAVAGGTVKAEATNIHRGDAALLLDGDGATASITISQTVAAGQLQAKTTYCIGAWLRKAGTVGAGSTLTVRVTGTGMSTATLFAADPTTLTTSYALKHAFFTTPEALPTDVKFEIVWSSANTAGATADVLVDDVVLVQPLDFGHVQYAVFAGSSDFVRGDAFEVTTATDNGGVFQTAFARWWNVALPSETGSGGPTIADSLAT